MVPKVARILRLLEEGHELEAIDSDHGAVEARLRHGTAVTVIRLTPSEAEELLYKKPRTGIRR